MTRTLGTFLIAVGAMLVLKGAYLIGVTEGSHTAFAVCTPKLDSVITHPVRPARNP